MKTVRFGITTPDGVSSRHAEALQAELVPRATLAVVCGDEHQAGRFAPARSYPSYEEMIRSGEIDAIIVDSSHPAASSIVTDALENGLHVLMERPVEFDQACWARMLAAHVEPHQVFGLILPQRTNPHYQKIRELIQSGELGTIHRVEWVATNWFRSQAYYDSSERGKGGGGLLLTQCPQILDLWAWLFGMPSQVRAHCRIGRFHQIDVEDEVTAFMEYANATSGIFIASTGEAPGVNRLEISSDMGLLTLERGTLKWLKNEAASSAFSLSSSDGFQRPDLEEIEYPAHDHGDPKIAALTNFVAAVLDGEELIAPASQGPQWRELANAMMKSSQEGRMVDPPTSMDENGA